MSAPPLLPNPQTFPDTRSERSHCPSLRRLRLARHFLRAYVSAFDRAYERSLFQGSHDRRRPHLMGDPPKKQQRKRPTKQPPDGTDGSAPRRAQQLNPRGRQSRSGRSPAALRWKRGLKARTLRALSADSTSSAPSCTPSPVSATPPTRAPSALDTPFRAFPIDAPKTTASDHHAAPSASTDTTAEALLRLPPPTTVPAARRPATPTTVPALSSCQPQA
ncbi:MICAL-like protein 1 [Dermacentor albipictus]|uniref:MICAL-like protein 1 n=1 Tax=Dermacentor albipictus TaxID=60249 RepID=UPI0031FBDAF4